MNANLKALIGLFSLLFLFTGIATAQDLDLSDFETLDDEDDIDFETVVFDIDNVTRVVDYEFRQNNQSSIFLESDTPRRIEVYDLNAFTESGNEKIAVNDYRINEGYSEILTDTTSKRGDRTLLIVADDNYHVLSNDRTSELIGTPESAFGVVLSIVGGGISVLAIIILIIKYRNRKIDKNGIRLY